MMTVTEAKRNSTATLAEDSLLEKATMGRVRARLLPFLMICYFFCLLDRTNLGIASLQMNKDIGLSQAAFGLGGTMFFVAYFLFEVPSNLALQKVGARLWIARIMITWGLASAAMALVVGPYSFYAVRFLLGAGEAGFFPGVILYLTYWMPSEYRARVVAIFMVSIPLASFIGSPISAWLLGFNGHFGLKGWQWLFLLEAVPTILLGLLCFFVLTDRPETAKWLTLPQRDWLITRLATESKKVKPVGHMSFGQLLKNKYILAMILICCGASAAGTSLSVWQPRLLKTFGLTSMQVGLFNMIPYGLASILMILWGRHSDRSGERRWHTALPLAMIAVGLGLVGVTHSLALTVFMLSLALVGAYSFKGPFWALTSGWISASTAAAGLAVINASSNLIGGWMISLIGFIKQAHGSYAVALLPLVVLTALGSFSALVIGRGKAGK